MLQFSNSQEGRRAGLGPPLPCVDMHRLRNDVRWAKSPLRALNQPPSPGFQPQQRPVDMFPNWEHSNYALLILHSMKVIGLGNALSDPQESSAFRLWLALWMADMVEIESFSLEAVRKRYPTVQFSPSNNFVFFARDSNRALNVKVFAGPKIIFIKGISIIVPEEQTKNESREAN